jgi:putative ABC transport system substrate-binding protein
MNGLTEWQSNRSPLGRIRTPMGEPFRAGLREGGWIDGQNVTIDWRFAAGDLNKLVPLAADLVKADADVIVTTATPAAKAAQSATHTIPIVAIDPGDPVHAGLVASLARPGANITAESSIAPDLQAKRLELLKEIAPNVCRLAVLSNALLVFPDPLTFTNARLIVDLGNKNKIPTMFGAREFVNIVGLMSYGPNYPKMYRRAGIYVGRILKGKKPADLPVEQPTRFEFILNAKTVKALGLTVPPMLLATADDIIE